MHHILMMEKIIFLIVLILSLGLRDLEAATSRQPLQKTPKGLQTRQSFGCSKDEFTCGNNQCIPSSAVCNGIDDCQDATDEEEEHCIVIQTGTCTGRKRVKNFCDDLPDKPAQEEQNITTHQFFCHSDILKKEKPLSLTCSNRIWTPSTALCTRVCEPLTLSTSNVSCFRDHTRVNCSKPLLVGTKIYPQCDFYYQPSVKEIVCQENGEWSDKSVRCNPMCGRQFKDRMRYTREMRSVEYREFPWNIAIYYTKPGTRDPILIPGTIISPYLIVTTAINFYSDYERGVLKTESMNVVVAKRTREVESMDDQFQKSYKVQGIYFTETGFQTSQNSLSSSENIAIIELGEKLVLSPSVYPACVNWEKNETLYPQDGEIGQVPHTLTIHEANAQAITQHEVLQTLALRFVGRDQCLNAEPIKSIPYAVHTDNFCGEPISAPAPCDGAFVFLEMNTNRFYVQGLVDGITPSMDTPPLFTNTFVDLSAHIDWMNAVRKHNEDRLVNSDLHLEVLATDTSLLCSKNNDLPSDPNIDLRFGGGKERRSEADPTGEANSPEECLLPIKASLNANNYSISCPVNNENNSCRRIKENSMVPQYTSVKLGCKEGFAIEESDEEAVCFKGQWSPVLTPCIQHCGKLPKFENGNFTCYEENQLRDCTDRLRVGSKLEPRCNSAYKTERNTEPQEIVCQDDGKWVGTVPKCVKKSGQEAAQSKSNNRLPTRNQNGPSQNEGRQPSTRNSGFAPSNSRGSNRTSFNPTRGSTQANRASNTPETIQPRPDERSRSRINSNNQTSTPSTRGSQAGIQTRNGLDSGDDNIRWQSGDQNLNEDRPDVDNGNEDEKCSENEFSCGELCVPHSAVCNGTAECEDGRDESTESCKILIVRQISA